MNALANLWEGKHSPYLGNCSPLGSFCDWLTTFPMEAPGSFPPPLAPSSNQPRSLNCVRLLNRPCKRRVFLPVAPPSRQAHRAAAAIGGGGCSSSGGGSRATVYREGARGQGSRDSQRVAGGDCSLTAGRAAAGSGPAFESPAPGLCALAPCSVLGPGVPPADLCAPVVPERRAQLFGKGAA